MLPSFGRSKSYPPGRTRDRRAASSPWWHARWRWVKQVSSKRLSFAALLIAISLLPGCSQILSLDAEEWQALCTTALWCPSPEKLGELVDTVFHSFAGSPATPEAARTVIRQVLRRVVDRPNSHTRWWIVGERTALISDISRPALVGRSRRAQKEERERWLATTEATLISALTPLLSSPPPEPHSLAEGIATVAVAAEGATPGLGHQLIIVSDGREASLKRVGCEIVMANGTTLSQLPWRRVLTPGLLPHSRVHLVFFNPPVLPGLPESFLMRFELLKALWGGALWDAGASEVFIESGEAGVHFLDAAYPFRDRNPFWLLPEAPEREKPPGK